ncbi:ABC transporter ATP-binding protein [Marinobacter sp. DUT-3]|uniref:ABC transporter ATP-binding protein n=1 Tax=Marinobacter sp. DUT-3 TaxID=3412036 RepID=UPI003D17DD62
MLYAKNISVRFGPQRVLDDIDLSIPAGRFTALVGANGCGKTTLLNVLAQLIRPGNGTVSLGDEPLAGLSRQDIARRIALLPQMTGSPVGLSVRELVMQGRYPWQNWWRQWSPEDQIAIDNAVALTHIEPLLDRPLNELSGGQRQRCWIAMTLAQDTPVLLLDEPTTYLDIAHQVELLELAVDLAARGKTVVAVLHDLNQAACYADHLVMLRDGVIHAEGEPEAVFTSANLDAVFGFDAHIIRDPHSGNPLCVPRSGAARREAPQPEVCQ